MPSTELGVGVRGLEELDVELLAMGSVVYPAAGGGDPLACGDRGGMADQVTRSRSPRALTPRELHNLPIDVGGRSPNVPRFIGGAIGGLILKFC
jgi:hypothetical protein